MQKSGCKPVLRLTSDWDLNFKLKFKTKHWISFELQQKTVLFCQTWNAITVYSHIWWLDKTLVAMAAW